MKASYKGGDYVQPPEGSHVARVYQIVDLGMQESPLYGEKRQILMGYELCEELMADGRPFTVSKFYTLSLKEKATLCKDIEGMTGKKLSDDAKETFDFQRLIGTGCMLALQHETKEGKTRTKIATVSPVPKGLSPRPLVNPPIFFDLDKPDMRVFEKLPDWMKKKINFELVEKPEAVAPAADDDIPFE